MKKLASLLMIGMFVLPMTIATLTYAQDAKSSDTAADKSTTKKAKKSTKKGAKKDKKPADAAPASK